MRRQHWIVSDYQRIVTNVVLTKLDTAESVSRLKLLNMCLSCCWTYLVHVGVVSLWSLWEVTPLFCSGGETSLAGTLQSHDTVDR